MLTGAVQTFTDNCVSGITANEERCKDLLYHSTGFVTALCPVIGYKASADIAKKFLKDGTPIVEGALAMGVTQEQLDEALNAEKLCRQFDKH